MNVIKRLLQVILSVAYSAIFIMCLYYIVIYPLAWILTLSWWETMLFLVFGTGILEAISTFLLTWLLVPYMWIVKHNSVAMWVSILTILIGIGDLIYVLWSTLLGNGFWSVLLAIVYSIVLIQLLFAFTSSIYTFKTEDLSNN